MSTESQTTDDSRTDTQAPIQSFPKSDGGDEKWRVESEHMTLARVSYSEYELGHNSLTVTFDDIRIEDEDADTVVYELRDGHDVQGTFDPSDEDVPGAIQIAFEVLAHEL